MITIDQKSFEVKENAEISVVGTAQTQKTVKNDLAGKSVLSKEVDKIVMFYKSKFYNYLFRIFKGLLLGFRSCKSKKH